MKRLVQYGEAATPEKGAGAVRSHRGLAGAARRRLLG